MPEILPLFAPARSGRVINTKKIQQLNFGFHGIL
jgi:predicted YcjX-like family ATPase